MKNGKGMRKMRIAICDDEPYFRKELVNALDIYSRMYKTDIITYEFSNGLELLASKLSFDLIFMDYQMDDKNGIDTIRGLRKRNDNTTVVFVSSFKDVVFESMKYNTFRFLVKPIETEKLHEAISMAISNQQQNHKIIVRDEVNNKNISLSENDIICIQADNNQCIVATENNVYKYTHTLSNIENQLSSSCFYRTSRTYIINFKYVEKYTKRRIILTNGDKAELSAGKIKDFINCYSDYLTKESLGLL